MGDDCIVAVVISHAHVDHYSDIEGLIDAEDGADASLPPDEQIASGKTAIIVPQGFADAVMKENVFVGTAMKRRAIYQYGSFLPYSEQGRFSVGIAIFSTKIECLRLLLILFRISLDLIDMSIQPGDLK